MPLANAAKAFYKGTVPVKAVYKGTTKIWPSYVAPTLTSITPTAMNHLSGAITLTATGTNFKTGCVLQIKLTSASTWTNISGSTVVSPTTMTGSVDMYPAAWEVSVWDGTTRTAEKAFTGNHDTPVLSSISPTSAHVSEAGKRLTVTGSNFYAGGSGYTGMTIYVLQPGGSWQGRTATVTSSTSAYTDGFDPGVAGTWKVMCGYDGPNTTRSVQKDYVVTSGAVINSVSPTTIDRGTGYDLVINGYGL